MSSTSQPAATRADAVISLVLLVTFVAAWVAATDWPGRAALFPRIVTAAGVVLCLLKLGQIVVSALRHRTTEDEPGDGLGNLVPVEDNEDEHAIEYIFATAGAVAWTRALAWIGAFFLALWLFGMFWTVPVFTVAYLVVAGRKSWLAAVLYAAVTQAVLLLAFQILLQLPHPRGLL